MIVYTHTHIILILSLWESLSSNRGVCLFEQGNSSEALRRFEHLRSFSQGLRSEPIVVVPADVRYFSESKETFNRCHLNKTTNYAAT